jgi:hypothetical protein
MSPKTKEQLEKEIAELLGLEQERVSFSFEKEDGIVRLNLSTTNPRHEMRFLYHSEKGVDEMDALNKMYRYVTEHNSEENTYTVQWMASGDTELHTSYFRAKNMYQLLDKFFFSRSVASCKIFSINLNPVS